MQQNSPKYFDPRTLAKLSGLMIRARHVVEGYVAGAHRSPYRGFSIEFAEHREYSPGDDLRHVDWKVFGRTDKIYLKQYEDETNLGVNVLLDISQSMAYRGGEDRLTKLEYAQCLAASLAWLVLEQHDAVGLATFDDQIRTLLPTASGPQQLREAIKILELTRPERASNMGSVFHELAQRFRKRGLVIVLSDLLDDLDSLAAGLKHLRHNRHDVIVLHLLDPAELEFPFDRPTLFRGLEAGPRVMADGRLVRRAYLQEVERFLHGVKSCCHDQQIDYRLLRTDLPLDAALGSLLASRMSLGK